MTVYNSDMKLPSASHSFLPTIAALGAVGIATAQTFPGPLPSTLSGDVVEDALPRYQIEVIAFAYHDFDPSEENFEQPPRGTLLDLLAPNLLETEAPNAPDPESLELETIPNPDLLALESRERESEASSPVEEADEPESNLNAFELPEQGPRDSEIDSELSGFGDDVDATTDSMLEQTEPDFFEDGLWYRLLTSEQLELVDEFNRLDRLDAYTPLVHGGWIQEGRPEQDAIPFELSLLGAFNPRGTIRLHVSRFLHVKIDLRYQSDAATAPAGSRAFNDLSQLEFPPRYDLDVQRLTRSGELHFFDHPAFGVLVLVQPLPEEPETTDEALSPAA